MSEYTVLDDNQSRRPAIDIAKEIIADGDARGSAARHSTTILTRQVLEMLVKEVAALRALPAQGGPLAAIPSSPPALTAARNSGEGDLQVTADWAGGEAIFAECAEIALEHVDNGKWDDPELYGSGYDNACRDIADAIKLRASNRKTMDAIAAENGK